MLNNWPDHCEKIVNHPAITGMMMNNQWYRDVKIISQNNATVINTICSNLITRYKIPLVMMSSIGYL